MDNETNHVMRSKSSRKEETKTAKELNQHQWIEFVRRSLASIKCNRSEFLYQISLTK